MSSDGVFVRTAPGTYGLRVKPVEEPDSEAEINLLIEIEPEPVDEVAAKRSRKAAVKPTEPSDEKPA